MTNCHFSVSHRTVQEARMAQYRFYVMDRAGRIISKDDLDCMDDEHAAITGETLLRRGMTVQVWIGTRRVIRLEDTSTLCH
jgi:hypothetical protein